ncbi:hypothetical protein [Gallaecimonas mangrovi]|uniref:hypothetical protein n=1 Tax=Gallaecimonas mangrovi TaxID=2291597 RepID=UPI0012603B4D|nr:hypothetical protein [Gallaecimonas mangrovi]
MKRYCYFILFFVFSFKAACNTLHAAETCPIHGVIPGNYGYYAIFNFQDITFALPVVDSTSFHKSTIPTSIVSRLPLSFVNVKGGYVWQGYLANQGDGIFEYKDGHDIPIKLGHFISVFSIKGNIYTIKVDNDNSVLYKFSEGSKRVFERVLDFDGKVAAVTGENQVMQFHRSDNESTYFISGENGWAYSFSDNEDNDGYLKCFHVNEQQ